VRIREFLPLGRRVEAFALGVWQDGKLQEIVAATSIGNCRLLRLEHTTTSKVRLRITAAAAPPAISEFSLFLDGERKWVAVG
jgi:alpha-L-fucosidase